MQAVTDLGAAARHRGVVRGAGAAEGHLLPRAQAAPAAARRGRSHRALGADERRAVLDVLHEPRFADLAPAEVYATLLDEGRYLCSERTMYRVLAENAEVRERRDQLRHPQLHGARAARHRAEPALELGHHQAARPGEVDLLLPVRDPRHLQPLRGRLDAGAPRDGGARRAADPRDLRAPGHRSATSSPSTPTAAPR